MSSIQTKVIRQQPYNKSFVVDREFRFLSRSVQSLEYESVFQTRGYSFLQRCQELSDKRGAFGDSTLSHTLARVLQ
jgi:hypothetical protein